jgi:23S rRNA pseudouridine2605 synthase
MERLQKILSRAGAASRRASEELIQTGRVTVNGATVTELGSRADPLRDEIRLDGRRLRLPQEHVYLVLNKPRGFVTTRRDPQGRRTVMELVPNIPGLFPVGRLDLATEGLILLTNDGDFAERVAHPRYEIPRTYRAKVHGIPDPATFERMRRGIRVEGERLGVDAARLVSAENNAWIEVTLHEGKHHEIRRLLAALGHPVAKLTRIRIGCITDRGLPVGACRPLTPRERRDLQDPASGQRRPQRAKDQGKPRSGGAPRRPGAAPRRAPSRAARPRSAPRRRA